MRNYNFGPSFKAGYAYSRSFIQKQAMTNLPVANMNKFAFTLGRTAGATVNITLRVAHTLFSAATTVGRWIRSNVLQPLSTTIRGIPAVCKKVVQNGKVVAIKVINALKAVGKEVVNIGKDIKQRAVDVKNNTKEIYNLKKNRYTKKHGKQPSTGTKVRYAYDSFVKGRVDAADDALKTKANSKTVQFTRDFRNAANKAVKKTVSNLIVRAKDAALIGAGVYALTQSFDSPESDKGEN